MKRIAETVAQLSKRTGANTLYTFDEPTTGSHFDYINKLLAVFRALIEAGGSVLSSSVWDRKVAMRAHTLQRQHA